MLEAVDSSPEPPHDAFRAEAVQVGAVDLQPRLGALGLGKQPARQLPEHRRMVHVHDMRDLVRGEIVEHIGRREDQPPGEIETAGRRARAPAARGVAQARCGCGATPSRSAWRATAASRSSRASRLRKSATRRAICGVSPLTQMIGPRAPVSVQTTPRSPGRCTIGGRRRAAASPRRARRRPAAAAARAARRSRPHAARRIRAPSSASFAPASSAARRASPRAPAA